MNQQPNARQRERERDRERWAHWRLILSVVTASGLVLTFGGLAMRNQRKELLLQHQLALADLSRQRDERLERAGRAGPNNSSPRFPPTSARPALFASFSNRSTAFIG